jgi:hypothetical protein
MKSQPSKAEKQELASLSTEELAAKVNDLHSRIERRTKRILLLAKRAGDALRTAKPQVARGHWEHWLEQNFRGSKETACGYMRVSENWRDLKDKQSTLREALEFLREHKASKKINKDPIQYHSDLAKQCHREITRAFSQWTEPQDIESSTKGWSEEEVIFFARFCMQANSFDEYWAKFFYRIQEEIRPLVRAFAKAEADRYRATLLRGTVAKANEQFASRIQMAFDGYEDYQPLTSYQRQIIEAAIGDHSESVEELAAKHEPVASRAAQRFDFVGLVTCGNAKQQSATEARKLYRGSPTVVPLRWMDRNCKEWYILSAKHGLLPPDQVTEPYNRTLTDMTTEERRQWGRGVRKKLPRDRPILFLGPRLYLDCIEDADTEQLPITDAFEALSISNRGKRMSWCKQNPVLTESLAKELGVLKDVEE